MASLFGALGSLAESYGLARQNIVEQQRQQAEARLAEERVNLEREQIAQGKARLLLEQSQARRPFLMGQAYKKDGKWVQPIWDPLANQGQGALSELEEGAVDNPLAELMRQGKAAGLDYTPQQYFAALYPQTTKAAEDYDLKVVRGTDQQGKPAWVYAHIPKDPTKQTMVTHDVAYERPVTGAAGTTPLTSEELSRAKYWGGQLAQNKITVDDLPKLFPGKQGDRLREYIAQEAFNQGWNPAARLSTGGAKAVAAINPVLEQANKLRKHIEALHLQNNNTRGYLLGARLDYATGGRSPIGTLGNDIANLSLGAVREGATALSGSSRSMNALRIALDHTPNTWKDSPALIYEKLGIISDNLNVMLQDAMEFQTKSGFPNPNIALPGGAGGVGIPGTSTTMPSQRGLTPGQQELMKMLYPGR